MSEFNDLTGKRFGRLIVKNRVENKEYDSGSQLQYLCLCDCGNETIVHSSALKAKLTKSCGCLHKEKTIKSNSLRPYEAIYHRLLQHSKPPFRKKTIKVSLTYKQYVKFTKEKNCHYCNQKINWEERRGNKKSSAYNLDRKDSNLGYSVDNCVVCCKRCNWAKSSEFSYKEWLVVGKAIQKFREEN
jgi:hypothetical protein